MTNTLHSSTKLLTIKLMISIESFCALKAQFSTVVTEIIIKFLSGTFCVIKKIFQMSVVLVGNLTFVGDNEAECQHRVMTSGPDSEL